MAFKMRGFSGFKQAQKDYEKEGYGDEALISGATESAVSYTEATPPDWSGVGKALGEAIVDAGVFAASDEGQLKRDKRWAKKRGFDPTEFVEEEGFEFGEDAGTIDDARVSEDPKKRLDSLIQNVKSKDPSQT